ncbi:trace amine-associated receptor 13c-like [Protopterus annectens]|uniref:trace amine-associated receptor 13c-like n=1 Tax=Protopterus annectens TaxID=7888 RepID=UPI001CFA5728|nr:trace amine-associated receptor 13c-like [Protopterus annectens]
MVFTEIKAEIKDSEDIQYCFSSLNGSCSKEPRPMTTRTLLYILFSVGIMTTICGNLMVIISISHFKQLHSPTNFLILSLAVADLLVGLTVMPFSMIRTVENCWYFGDIICVLHNSFDVSLTSASIIHLIFIAIDRYYAICDPLHYTNKINNNVVGIYVTVSWIFPVIYTCISLFSRAIIDESSYITTNICLGSCHIIFNETLSIVDSLISFFIPCSLMLCMYVKVFFVAQRHLKAVNSVEASFRVRLGRKMAQSSDHKAAKILTAVMSVFILSYLPIFIDSSIDPYINYSTPTIVSDALLWLGYFNSACNPIVYAFFYPWFQKALKLIVSFKIFKAGSSSLKLFSNNS